MLRNKVFGAYDSDEEFRLVHFASMPLYKEVFDPDAALEGCLGTVYVAESHSEFCEMCGLAALRRGSGGPWGSFAD